MTGHYEPVEEISQILDEYEASTGISIPIHVDAASGGFIAPFVDCRAGGAKWNFELPRVVSINASGHKYGLVYPGVGWIVWRDEAYLPESLVFTLDYLGGQEKSFTLNFSRPGAQVIVQYYNLIHLGFSGYREIMENCLRNARLLAKSLEGMGWFTVLSDIHRPRAATAGDAKDEGGVSTRLAEGAKAAVSDMASRITGAGDAEQGEDEPRSQSPVPPTPADETSEGFTAGLPIVAFRLSDDFRDRFPHIQQSTVSFMMRAKHWIIPNYRLPPNEDATEIMRIVVRETMTYDIMERLLQDMGQTVQMLMERDEVDLSMLQQRRKKMELKGAKQEPFPDKEKMIDTNLHKSVC
jgi:glutamate decarboxylase